MQGREFLEKLYLKSLTPFEILDFIKKTDCNYIKYSHYDYLNYWKKTISNNKPEYSFSKYCLLTNLSDLDLFLMTSDIISLNEKTELPNWVNTLNNIITQLKYTSIYSLLENVSEKPFYHFFIPIINYFSIEVNQSNVKINAKLIEKLKDELYNELYQISYLTLSKEFKLERQLGNMSEENRYQKFIVENLTDGYQSIFLKYPMLARNLMTKVYCNAVYIKKILNNLYFDKNEIELSFNKSIGDVIEIDLNMGDMHNGESTAIIKFDNSYKIVYKPISVDITNSYNSIVIWINDMLNENLKIFSVLDKGTYGWIEFVEYSPCDTVDDVKLYYERAGILLGIAYILNSKDFHFENVIASGNSPVLIDHETIVNPSLNKVVKDKDEDAFDIIGTVLETSLIPTSKLDLPFFMYGFGSSESFKLKEIFDKINVEDVNNKAIKINVNKEEMYKLNKPIYNDIIENLIDYKIEFQKGFQKFYNLILSNKKYLLSNKSPFLDFHNYNVRFINRQTKVYHRILKYLDRPEYLSDALKFGIKLEVIARGYLNLPDRRSLLSSERTQMLNGNIPVFYINTNSKDLILCQNEKTDLIERTAVENIFHKISKFSLKDYEYQMELISEAVNL